MSSATTRMTTTSPAPRLNMTRSALPGLGVQRAPMDQRALWERYQRYLCDCPQVGLRLDISRMSFTEAFLQQMKPPIERAFDAMEALEGGAIANPDEQRMVGHYWLRAPKLAP